MSQNFHQHILSLTFVTNIDKIEGFPADELEFAEIVDSIFLKSSIKFYN